MQYSSFLLALTALSISASGLTLPLNTIPGTQTCHFTELKSNQSTVFGWQLAGIALDSAEKDAICNNLPCNVLANAGLEIQNIKTPACSASQIPTDAQSALPNVVRYTSDAFQTMLINAFPPASQSSYLYLCDNIRFAQLRAFMLNDASIINATCNLGGPNAQISPEPFTTLAKPNLTAVAAYKDITSKLFATNYAATANSAADLISFCDRANSYKANLEALQLDPATVATQICSFEAVPQVAETQISIMQLTSQQFVTVVENMSDVSGWNSWLCQELDEDAMDDLGLDGAWVKAQVCRGVVESKKI